ncbi:MAG: PfkB domain protein [Proteobacteria bacterium]|nr:PfkB domain protein [Pseudomonadota bacterium]
MPVISICLSPGLQRSVIIDTLIPGEVNRLKSVVIDVAGKGVNVCRVLQRLGIEALCLAQGGSNADEVMALARSEGLELRLIASSGTLRTCTSIIETSMATGRRVTELVEPSACVDEACVAALAEALLTLLPTASALVIAGSMAPGYPPGYQAHLADLARQTGVPVAIDQQGAALVDVLSMRPALVKINLAEFVATFLADRFRGGEHSGMLAQPALAAELTAAIADVSRGYATSFVLTRGANSIVLARDGQLRVVAVQPLAASEVVSPIGSGDSFLAGMLAQLLQTGATDWERLSLDDLADATTLATACAQSNARTARPGFLDESFARH